MQRPQPLLLEAGFAPQHSRQADQQQQMQRAACGQHHSCGTQQHRPVQGMPADGIGACGDQLIRRLGRRQRRKAGPETAKRLKGPKQAQNQQQQAQPEQGVGPNRHTEAGGSWPDRQQMGRDQQQLGQQPPLTAAVIQPAAPTEAPIGKHSVADHQCSDVTALHQTCQGLHVVPANQAHAAECAAVGVRLALGSR